MGVCNTAKLFTVLAWAAEWRVSEFNAQVLANTAWALATLKQPDVKLVTVLTRAAEWQVRELNSQNFANTAWACATLKQPDEKPFTSIHGLGVGG